MTAPHDQESFVDHSRAQRGGNPDCQHGFTGRVHYRSGNLNSPKLFFGKNTTRCHPQQPPQSNSSLRTQNSETRVSLSSTSPHATIPFKVEGRTQNSKTQSLGPPVERLELGYLLFQWSILVGEPSPKKGQNGTGGPRSSCFKKAFDLELRNPDLGTLRKLGES